MSRPKKNRLATAWEDTQGSEAVIRPWTEDAQEPSSPIDQLRAAGIDWDRVLKVRSVGGKKMPFDVRDEHLVRRESEAIGLYLFGEDLELANILWGKREYSTLTLLLVVNHPAWDWMSARMEPTPNGKPLDELSIRRYLESGARRLGVSVDQLRVLAMRGLALYAARKAAAESSF
jgi:hypothetical protein